MRPRASWGSGEVHDFRLRTAATVDFGEVSGRISYELDAHVRIMVVDKRGERATLHVKLSDVSITNRLARDRADFEGLARELREGACLAVLADGLLVEVGFHKGASNAASATFRQIVAGLQLVTGSEKSWEVEEYDTSGRYLARYTWDDAAGAYQKEKLRYLSLLGNPIVPGMGSVKLVPLVRKSVGRLRLSRKGDLEQVELDDILDVEGAHVPIHSSVQFMLNRLAVPGSGSVPNLTEVMSGFAMVSASEQNANATSIESLDRARTGGASFDEIVSRIEAERKGRNRSAGGRAGKRRARFTLGEAKAIGDVALFNSLVASVRESPGAIDRAVQMIRNDSPLSDVLVDALGSASSPRAQAALAALLPSADAETGRRILYALSQTPRPTDDGVAAMKALLAKQPFSQTGLLGLGAYARRFAEQGSRARAAELGEFLIEQLGKARGATSKITALRAIENSAYAPAVGAVQRYLGDQDPVVRVAALQALKPMKDPVVDGLLASRMRPGTSADETLLILAIIEARSPSDTLVGAVVDVSGAADAKVRRQAVGLLATWAAVRPHLREVLRRIGEADSDSQVRASARAAL